MGRHWQTAVLFPASSPVSAAFRCLRHSLARRQGSTGAAAAGTKADAADGGASRIAGPSRRLHPARRRTRKRQPSSSTPSDLASTAATRNRADAGTSAGTNGTDAPVHSAWNNWRRWWRWQFQSCDRPVANEMDFDLNRRDSTVFGIGLQYVQKERS